MKSITKSSLIIFILSIVTLLTVFSCSKEEPPVGPNPEPEPTLNLLYPNGGEIVFADSIVKILWSSSNIEFINIHFSSNSGNYWNEIANTITAELGEWDWTNPNLISDSCIIRIVSNADTSISDVCDSNFSIVIDANLNLLIPNGGELWESLTEYSITWTSENVNNIIIEYSIDNGNNWQIIDTVSALLDEYNWETHYQPSETYKIRISSFEHPFVADESDNNFTIVVSPRITESLDYYPLQVGNKWFYFTIIRHNWGGQENDTTYSVVEVMDTLTIDGVKKYKLKEFNGLGNSLYYDHYVDKLSGIVHRSNHRPEASDILVDLSASPGDTIIYQNSWTFAELLYVLFEVGRIVLDQQTSEKGFDLVYFYEKWRVYFAKYLGINYYVYSNDFISSEKILEGCIINGVVYGDTTLPSNVNSLIMH
jgi:hypothetical protein